VIAAVARNGVIGMDNRLPWQLPADLKHFKELTTGHSGDHGAQDLGIAAGEKFRPLPGRRNIVVTRNGCLSAPRAPSVSPPRLPDAVALVGKRRRSFRDRRRRTLCKAALPLADRLQLTEIDADYAGDTWFPRYRSGPVAGNRTRDP
jgi:dihydrofolate reductase